MEKKNKNLVLVFGIVGAVLFVFAIPIIGILIAIAVPSFLRAREVSRCNHCQENLYMLDTAKQQWALDNNCDGTATPTWSDLIGENSYLRTTPICPSRGHYTIGTVDDLPKCSRSDVSSFPHEMD